MAEEECWSHKVIVTPTSHIVREYVVRVAIIGLYSTAIAYCYTHQPDVARFGLSVKGTIITVLFYALLLLFFASLVLSRHSRKKIGELIQKALVGSFKAALLFFVNTIAYALRILVIAFCPGSAWEKLLEATATYIERLGDMFWHTVRGGSSSPSH